MRFGLCAWVGGGLARVGAVQCRGAGARPLPAPVVPPPQHAARAPPAAAQVVDARGWVAQHRECIFILGFRLDLLSRSHRARLAEPAAHATALASAHTGGAATIAAAKKGNGHAGGVSGGQLPPDFRWPTPPPRVRAIFLLAYLLFGRCVKRTTSGFN